MPTRTVLKDSFLAQQSDDELVELARRTGNDDGAYEELYRRHENAARNVARHILRSRQDADDVVNEAFAGVISAISHGAGPRTNFRQYLMACVRNSCKSRRWCGGAISTDPSVMESNGAVFEDPERLSEAGLVASAFSSLSPDWQQTLWLTAVEERPTAEIAATLGRRPAAVAALAHRAREAFAEAYLAQHQARTTAPECSKIGPKLAHYVRGNSGDVDTVLVERHLVNCVACACAVDELRDVNSALRTLTGPGPLAGAGIAAGGAATVAGLVPFATAGGWTLGAFSGAALLKVAVLGGLLVPAAVVAAASATSNDSASPSAAAVDSVAGPSNAPGAVTLAGGAGATSPSGSGTSSIIDFGGFSADRAGGGEGGQIALGGIDFTSPVGDGGQVTVPTSPLGGDPLGTVSSIVGVTPGGVAVAATLPAGGGASATVGVGPTGVAVGVNVTVPILTIPVSVSISLPPISTPPIALPGISTPVVSTPVITTPPISVPAIGPLPSITVPSITVPSITVPSITLPPITIPSITLPPVTLPTITLPSITLPPILGF